MRHYVFPRGSLKYSSHCEGLTTCINLGDLECLCPALRLGCVAVSTADDHQEVLQLPCFVIFCQISLIHHRICEHKQCMLNTYDIYLVENVCVCEYS